MKKLDIRRACGALLAALLLTACLLPARSYAAQDAEVIHIGSEAELAELAGVEVPTAVIAESDDPLGDSSAPKGKKTAKAIDK